MQKGRQAEEGLPQPRAISGLPRKKVQGGPFLRKNKKNNRQHRQRIVRSMIRVGERTNNMRKPEKFEYRKHMTAAFMDMLELCIEANRARGQRRVELQNKMDTKLDVLRSLVDTAVSPEDRLISPGLHEVWSKELNEIGRMLGGWKKSNE